MSYRYRRKGSCFSSCLAALGAAALVLGAGCGDDGQPGDPMAGPDAGSGPVPCPEPLPAPTGMLSSPDELDRSACEPGALAGFDPGGLWYVTQTDGDSRSTGQPVQFSGCQEDLRAEMGSVFALELYASHDDDDLFWRYYAEYEGGRWYGAAWTVCGRDDQGRLTGSNSICHDFGQGVTCESRDITLEAFGRIPGEGEGEGLELVSAWRGAPGAEWDDVGVDANVRVVDGVAYVVRGEDGLRIVDVSDPTRPADLAHVPAPSDFWNDVKIAFGPTGIRYALVASAMVGVYVYDVSEPASPELAASFSTTIPESGTHTLFTESFGGRTYAYLAWGQQLGIFDVTDPADPTREGSYTLPASNAGIHDLFAAGGRVYLNATTQGLIVADTQPDPQNPTVVGQYLPPEPAYSHSNWVTTAGGRTVSVSGDEGHAAHVTVIDVDEASPQFMQPIGEFALRDEVSVHNIMAFGDRAYVAWYQDGVRILDLSDPTAPSQVAYYNTWDKERSHAIHYEGATGIDVDLDSDLIYVADTTRGLVVLRIIE